MYKYNIHTHTSEVSPCGQVCAEEVILEHKNAGFQGVAITDHFWPGFTDPRQDRPWEENYAFFKSGFEAAQAAGALHGLDVIYGMELRFEENANDYLVYGLPDAFVLANTDLTKITLAEFRSRIEGLDVLVIQAHPFRNWMTRMPAELLDGVEVFNANSRHDSRNRQAMNFAVEHGIIGISGSDYHQYDDIDRGGILVSHRIKDAKELNQVLRTRAFENIY